MPAPKKTASIAFAGAAAAAAVGYAAGPALAAAGHWHIKNGSTSVTFKAKLLKPAGALAHAFAGGVTHGVIKSISAQITGVNITVCKANVKGKLPAIFRNASHTFVADSKSAASLTLFSVTTCRLWKNSDKAFFQGTFPVTTPKTLIVSEP